LLGLPFLRVNQPSTATSAQYGSEHLWRILNGYVTHELTYDEYAHEFLDYVYYHNWYSTGENCASGSCAWHHYYSHLFWLGVIGKESNEAQVEELANKAKIKESSVITWEATHKIQDDLYNYGRLPPEVRKILSSKWMPGCNTKNQVRYGISLLGVEIPGANSHAVSCPEDLRIIERLSVKPRTLTMEQLERSSLCFYFDLRPFVRLDAANNLLITTFICILLCGASLFFSSDANRLVLQPVEKMIGRVEAIRTNPLIAIKMSDEEFKKEIDAKAKEGRKGFKQICKMVKNCLCCRGCQTSSTGKGPMETVILEKTIIKLGSLLALGFGEAGANIIGHNMDRTESVGVNAMIPGERVQCIIGIARIRNFAIATEVLQEKIMTFVNQIAEIVHGVVDEYQGAPNKNNGESFVIIWQMSRDASLQGLHEVDNDKETSRFAGLSIMAFVKIISSMQRSRVLAAYEKHPGLQQRLRKISTHCHVNLGFGLHRGWAIEGAVGSEFKINASYLSPNVSIANSLEGATILYGVSLLASDAVVDLCSPPIKTKCRLVDRVWITGSKHPIRLFSVDLDPLSLSVESKAFSLSWNARNRFKARQFIDQKKQLKMSEDVEMDTLFNADDDITKMRRMYDSAFFSSFRHGLPELLGGRMACCQTHAGRNTE